MRDTKDALAVLGYDPRAYARPRRHGPGAGDQRRLARMLGGEIDVESSPGQASTFMLRLPRRCFPRAAWNRDGADPSGRWDRQGRFTLKLANKQAALESLAKHLGMFIERSINANLDFGRLSDEQVARTPPARTRWWCLPRHSR